MKKKIVDAALATSVILIALVLLYGVLHGKKESDVPGGEIFSEEEEFYYIIDEHRLADFSDVIVEQFNKESDLVIYSVDASVSADIKETGMFDLAILNKTQKVTYLGTGRFYIDMDMLGRHSIQLDNETYTVTIAIPHVELQEIEIDPDRFRSEETEKGFLAFGEIKFTAEEYNDLQTECKRRIREAVDIPENREAADRRAVEEIRKIYEPIVQAVDDRYHVEIVFLDRQNGR